METGFFMQPCDSLTKLQQDTRSQKLQYLKQSTQNFQHPGD